MPRHVRGRERRQLLGGERPPGRPHIHHSGPPALRARRWAHRRCRARPSASTPSRSAPSSNGSASGLCHVVDSAPMITSNGESRSTCSSVIRAIQSPLPVTIATGCPGRLQHAHELPDAVILGDVRGEVVHLERAIHRDQRLDAIDIALLPEHELRAQRRAHAAQPLTVTRDDPTDCGVRGTHRGQQQRDGVGEGAIEVEQHGAGRLHGVSGHCAESSRARSAGSAARPAIRNDGNAAHNAQCRFRCVCLTRARVRGPGVARRRSPLRPTRCRITRGLHHHPRADSAWLRPQRSHVGRPSDGHEHAASRRHACRRLRPSGPCVGAAALHHRAAVR